MKKWSELNWWRKIVAVIGVLFIISAILNIIGITFEDEEYTPTVNKPEYDFELSIADLMDEFGKLTELQQEELSKKYKDQRIKTGIYAIEIDKASLSSQYVVKEMYEYPYSSIAYAKAFFPAEEKEKLLGVNIGDLVIFSGEFVSYKKGIAPTIEFTNSRFITTEPVD